MRIAIIGAGFAGLSVARHLIPRHSITLFDSKGAGAGASGIAAGLMHPYVGELGRRSLHATEALECSLGLIREVERELGMQLAMPGLVRHVWNEKQRTLFASHAKEQGDVFFLDEGRVWIDAGWTVDCPRYLAGLEKLLRREGMECVYAQVEGLSALDGFDQIIVCAGAGVRSLLPEAPLRISLMKGQILVCKSSSFPKTSLLGKGYLALSAEPGICYLGSTYEKNFASQTPDSAVARAEILPKIERFYPQAADFEVVDCRAAVRVTPQGHYFPILAKVQDRVWVVTGLGSRGLLYHGLLGKFMNEKL
jgi:glycine/D-amino acid oxidase-like deaminating enzyme